MAEILKAFQPSKYYSIFIDKKVRPDGRQLTQFGLTGISMNCINTSNGSSIANMRNTRVLCAVRAEIANPTPEEPRKGYVIPNIEFPPICSRRFTLGQPCEEAKVYTQLIENVLKDTLLIDPEDLCIEEGKLCWRLHIHVMCLNYGGNVLDACVLSIAAAIKSATLPEVSVNSNSTINISENKVPLPVKQLLFSSTFAVFENGIIADPTVDEETWALSVITIFVKEDGMICNIFMHRGSPLSEACVKECIQLTKKRSKELESLVANMLSYK